ncbi:MAG TPA: alpha/beta hydrolase [Candidatus Hydrogenedentes bacterium]|nr:alpha/beta hydrolase [Candidatus Hydrogenedentota bacterium]HNT88578.1 alpha/beta hydrolase [Candidatus Hydrogenedentota bacterium]
MTKHGVPLTPVPRRIPGDGGVGINVWDYGGDGAPLLLCHCTGGLARVWDPVVARLGGRFRVFAVDSRGHGDSDRPEARDAYEWIRSGRDLLAALDALGLGPGTIAAGHSAGGAHIAYAEMLRPGTFGRVLLIEPIIGPREVFHGNPLLAETARRRRNVFASRDEARARFAAKAPKKSWHPEALDAYVAYGLRDLPEGGVALKLPGSIEAFVYELGGACDVFDRLHELRFPALLVAGTASYGPALIAAQHERLPHAEQMLIDGAGHFLPQERPDDVARLIRDWFAGATLTKRT